MIYSNCVKSYGGFLRSYRAANRQKVINTLLSIIYIM